MKVLVIALLLIANIAPCYGRQPQEVKEIKKLYDKYNVDGSILIYDTNQNQYIGYNLDRCNLPHSPASTFKIANTLIGLETGVINTDSIFRWDGEKRQAAAWEADMNIYQAFKVSNVPVYQGIARSIGLERMKYYTRLFNYGEMDINSENIDKFWLEGNSKITQYQQIYFLKKLYNMELPLKEETMSATMQIMLLEETGTYKLSAKTGWAVREGQNMGWFVGYVESNNNVYYFATNIDPLDNTDMGNFGLIRANLTKDILSSLGIIK